MPEVKCSVSNCEYWAQGNNCIADVIMIEIDRHAHANFDEEFAGETYDSNHRDKAYSSSYTCCHTFEMKKSGKY